MKVEEQDIPLLMEDVDDVYRTLWDNLEQLIDLYEHLPSELKDEYGEAMKLGIPNGMTMLEMKYLQLCVMMLEEIVKYDQWRRNMNLLDMCRRKLKMVHEDAFYAD